MNVFRLDRDPRDGFDFALVDESSDRSIWNGFNGVPLAVQWRTPKITAVNVNDAEAEPDDFALLGTVPVFSLRTLEAMLDLLRPNGEVLPLHYQGAEYFAYNVTSVLPALDEESSILRRFPGGNVVMSISKYAFKPDILRDTAVFKIPQLPKAFVFVTDIFVVRVQSAGLTGFSFPLLWNSGSS